MARSSLLAVIRHAGACHALDADLLHQFVDTGDQTAFAELVRRHARLVWGLCRNLLQTEADADDAFQATFLTLARSARSIRDAARLGPWLHGVAFRVCQKARRAAARRTARERVSAVREAVDPVADSTWGTAAAAVHEEVSRLPESLRVTVVLCVLEGVAPTVAAEHLGLKWGTFAARLSRAKQRLLDRLSARGIGAAVAVGLVSDSRPASAAVVARAIALVSANSSAPAAVQSLVLGVCAMSFTRRTLSMVLVLAAVGVAALVVSGDGGTTMPRASAAPVPTDKEAKKKELEGLWDDLSKDEPSSSNAVLKLFKQPEHAVLFLKAKLQPLKLDAERCNQLLKDLGSEDEKTWKAAWDEFDYLDPRLAIDLPTLMKQVTENPARSRMVEVCSAHQADSLAGQAIQIRPVGNDGYNFSANNGSWWAEHKIERIGNGSWNPKKSWTRAARGVAILEQIGTPDAIKVLEQLADGHVEAMPTKAAVESLTRLKKK